MFSRTSLYGIRRGKDVNFTWIVCTPLQSVQIRVASSSIISKAETPGHISAPPNSAFSRLSTTSLLRAVILGAILKRSWLFNPGLSLMERLASSKSTLLDVDKNPLLRVIIRPLIYKQFCAGRNRHEIQETISSIKRMGYTGVILCYAREITIDKSDANTVSAELNEEIIVKNINAWRDGNLETLESVGEGDYIGIKQVLTGADVSISQDIAAGKQMRADFLAALDQVCQRAKEQGKYVWIDAEEQIYHPAIDKVAIDLMRQHNADGQVHVLNTVQAYLKSARRNLEWQLNLAQTEGWALGIKLVRGAYIASESRNLIHDTKADTDACYDGIVHDVLARSWPKIDPNDFPKMRLFLAGHNHTSIRKACGIATDLSKVGNLPAPIEFGQLQGMADDIGCELLEKGEKESKSQRTSKVFKCLTWGSVKQCLHYLVRRAIENRGAAERLNSNHAEMMKELRKRLLFG